MGSNVVVVVVVVAAVAVWSASVVVSDPAVEVDGVAVELASSDVDIDGAAVEETELFPSVVGDSATDFSGSVSLACLLLASPLGLKTETGEHRLSFEHEFSDVQQRIVANRIDVLYRKGTRTEGRPQRRKYTSEFFEHLTGGIRQGFTIRALAARNFEVDHV